MFKEFLFVLWYIAKQFRYKDYFDFLDKQHFILYGDNSIQLIDDNEQTEAKQYNKIIRRLKLRHL